jgi:hypothetical protein
LVGHFLAAAHCCDYQQQSQKDDLARDTTSESGETGFIAKCKLQNANCKMEDLGLAMMVPTGAPALINLQFAFRAQCGTS